MMEVDVPPSSEIDCVLHVSPRPRAWFGSGVAWLLLASQAVVAEQPPGAASPRPVTERVVALFQARCVRCHGEQVRKGGLSLRTLADVAQGGESGAVVVPRQPEQSSLLELVRTGAMPPPDSGDKPLATAEVKLIEEWIHAGWEISASELKKAPHEHDVLPILYLRCVVCHGHRVTEGGLDLRSRESMLRGGKSGPAIKPGDPEGSLLIRRLRREEMPPRARVVEVSIKPMESTEIERLAAWIAAGAPVGPVEPDVATSEPDPLVSAEDRRFWSFQTPQRPAVPVVRGTAQVRTPVDAFVLQKLEEVSLSLAADAERQVLIRRLSFDLRGLPPTPEEVEAFCREDRPDAWERLVDHYLASPEYGERWARYWLDLAGYADSNGVQHSDPIRDHNWRYRDYVIRAWNADKPYDRFLLEQIAGDELEQWEPGQVCSEVVYDNLVATGFLRQTPDGTSANITNFVPDRLELIADELHVLSSGVLGLTLRCARCHTHKSDPIPQRDYYRLAAVFKGAYDEHDWLKPTRREDGRGPWGERLLDVALSAERTDWEAREQRIQAQKDRLTATLREQTVTRRQVLREERLAALPEPLRQDLREMLATPADRRSTIQKYLAEKFESQLALPDAEVHKLNADLEKLAATTKQQAEALDKERTPRPAIHALWDRGQPSPTYVLRRGDYTQPGAWVGPGVLSVLTDGQSPLVVLPPWPGAQSTGRRLAFARDLTRPDHPLTARVIANRLWRHHFGTGIVRTLDNFGVTGERPSHPELLDWLSAELVSHGWSLKHLHRVMLLSSTYRQTSQTTAPAARIDPDNRLWSRMPLRRLEAESLRDSLLAVADRLNRTTSGPPDPVDQHPQSGLVTTPGPDRPQRRTIYLLQRRTQPLTLLEDFDLPAMNPNCIDRPISTVAPQALHLSNSAAIQSLAAAFAERLRREAGDSAEARISRAWQWAFGRRPTSDEQQLATAALQRLAHEWSVRSESANAAPSERTPKKQAAGADQALINLCHALLNSAEFLVID